MNCRDCTQPLTASEIRNGRRCDKCEQKWLDQVGEWIRGEGPEPEWGDPPRQPSMTKEQFEDNLKRST
jgi:hypothetical protein